MGLYRGSDMGVVEDYYTNECDKSRYFKICSECSSNDRVFHQGKETVKKCLNCRNNHSALAMKCQKRKDIIKVKRIQENEKEKMTYSNMSGNTTT